MNPDLVRNYLTSLQDRLCATLEEVDGKAKFITDEWKRAEGGGGRSLRPPRLLAQISPAKASARWVSQSSSIRSILIARRRT